MSILNDSWEEFRDLLVTASVDRKIINHMRLAFYSGANTVLREIIDPNHSHEERQKNILAMGVETSGFIWEVKKEVARQRAKNILSDSLNSVNNHE